MKKNCLFWLGLIALSCLCVLLFIAFPFVFPQAHDDLAWQQAQRENTVAAYERYLANHPDGQFVDEAREAIHNLAWQQAQQENTVVAYERYLANYPDGQFVDEARAKIEALLQDDTPYLAAREQGTREAFRAFLVNFPGHSREGEVLSILKDVEGRDLIDLLNEGKVEIRTRGSGIDKVLLEIRRHVDYEVTVHIPLGTLFISHAGSVQNMVTIQEREVALRTEEWVKIKIPVACANMHLDVPGSQDTFTIARSPQQKELERLLPILQTVDVDFDVKQAAIWIVTDNADYSDLGILVSGLGGFHRLINEDDAALAMKLVDEAGIDITRQAIWQDRFDILAGLTNEDLKRWLEEKIITFLRGHQQ